MTFEERVARIKKEAKKGLSRNEVAEKLSLTPYQLSQFICKRGVEVNFHLQRRKIKKSVSELLKIFNKTKTLTGVASEVGVSPSTLLRHLEKLGVREQFRDENRFCYKLLKK